MKINFISILVGSLLAASNVHAETAKDGTASLSIGLALSSTSSIYAQGKDDILLFPIIDAYWENLYFSTDGGEDSSKVELIRRHTLTGRPSDDKDFLKHLEHLTAQDLRKKKPGPRRA